MLENAPCQHPTSLGEAHLGGQSATEMPVVPIVLEGLVDRPFSVVVSSIEEFETFLFTHPIPSFFIVELFLGIEIRRIVQTGREVGTGETFIIDFV